MLDTKNSLLAQEWITLQNNYEQYEKTALFIKLTSIILFFISLILSLDTILSSLLLLILWLQEGIWRTYQSRIANRILMIEKCLSEAEGVEAPAFQLHRIWQVSRLGTLGLVKEYLHNSVRPTVAYPYVVLLLINVLIFFYTGRY